MTEASLGLRYLEEHFGSDETAASAVLWKKAVEAREKRTRLARAAMMRANDPDAPLSLAEKEEAVKPGTATSTDSSGSGGSSSSNSGNSTNTTNFAPTITPTLPLSRHHPHRHTTTTRAAL